MYSFFICVNLETLCFTKCDILVFLKKKRQEEQQIVSVTTNKVNEHYRGIQGKHSQ